MGPTAKGNAGLYVIKNFEMLGHSIQLGSGSSEHGALWDSVWVTAYEAGPGKGSNDPGSGWWPVLHGPTFSRLATQRASYHREDVSYSSPTSQDQWSCFPPTSQQELLSPREGEVDVRVSLVILMTHTDMPDPALYFLCVF